VERSRLRTTSGKRRTKLNITNADCPIHVDDQVRGAEGESWQRVRADIVPPFPITYRTALTSSHIRAR
jgi:hypothetical protein